MIDKQPEVFSAGLMDILAIAGALTARSISLAKDINNLESMVWR